MAPLLCSATRLPPIHRRPLGFAPPPHGRFGLLAAAPTYAQAYQLPRFATDPPYTGPQNRAIPLRVKFFTEGRCLSVVLRHALSLPSGISVPAASRKTEGTLGGDRLYAGSATRRFYGFEFLLFRENSALKSAKQRTRAKGVKRCLWRCLQRSFSTDFSTGSMRKASCPSC